jgi:hypothetical protein
MLAAGTGDAPRDKDVAAVLGLEPLVSFANGAAPARAKDRKTAYYGGSDAISAHAYVGACAPSFLFFGTLAGKGAGATREVLAKGFDEHVPERTGADPGPERLAGLGFKVAPGFLDEKPPRIWFGGLRPRDFARDRASDLLHANRSGTAILNLLALARTYLRTGQEVEGTKLLAFALGHIAHSACDLVWHPAQATLAGPVRDPSFEWTKDEGRLTGALVSPRRFVDLHLDAWTALCYFGRPAASRRWSLPLDELARQEASSTAAAAGRGIDALYAEVACEAYALAYPGEERAFEAGEALAAIRFFRDVMLGRVYRRPGAILPAAPLVALASPGYKGREAGAVSAGVASEVARRAEVGEAARELTKALDERRAADAEGRKKQAAKERELAAKLAEKEKALLDDHLLGEGAASILDLFSMAAKLAARQMIAAARFVRQGDAKALETLANWSLDSGYRLEPAWDEEAKAGSFPRITLKYRHVSKDLAERRLFDLDGLDEAPRSDGRTLKLDLAYGGALAEGRNDRFTLREGNGARWCQVLETADALANPADPARLALAFTDVKPGKKYTLECDPGPEGSRYFLFRDRTLDADLE